MPPAVPFHFDARGDSSEEEEDGIDLAAWQSTTKAPPTALPPAPAPVAQMVASDVQVVESSATPEPATLDSARKRKRATTSESPAEIGSGFQAINSSRQESQRSTYNLEADVSQEPVPTSTHEEEAAPRRNGKSKVAPGGLVVHIPEIEVQQALKKKWEDLTRGEDRVRRVLRERYDDDGTVLYKVQFDDYHDEEVCLTVLSPYALRFSGLCAVAGLGLSLCSCFIALVRACRSEPQCLYTAMAVTS